MRLLTLLAALAISTTAAVAQTPAVKSPSANNPAAPVPGANSFTEGQAKSRIEGAGYSDVTALKKDANGVWTGSARRAARWSP
jgi:putative membrane protein